MEIILKTKKKSKYGWVPRIVYGGRKKKYEFLLNKKPTSKIDAADVFRMIFPEPPDTKLIMKIGFKRAKK